MGVILAFDTKNRGDYMDLLNNAVKRTTEYIEIMPKTLRKSYGQFFTIEETAVFMASLFDLSECSDSISVLDPGAGRGYCRLLCLKDCKVLPSGKYLLYAMKMIIRSFLY